MAYLLEYVPSKRKDTTHLSFALGAYGHRSYTGLLQNTKCHPSVCLLLNGLVALLCPTLSWTTLTVNVDFEAPIHVDSGNAPLNSLVVGLSHFEIGGLWICSGEGEEAGNDYEEHHGKLLRGSTYAVSGEAVLFPARYAVHLVRPWQRGNRITLVAHAIGQHHHLQPEVRDLLTSLRFGLPGHGCAAAPVQVDEL